MSRGSSPKHVVEGQRHEDGPDIVGDLDMLMARILLLQQKFRADPHHASVGMEIGKIEVFELAAISSAALSEPPRKLK